MTPCPHPDLLHKNGIYTCASCGEKDIEVIMQVLLFGGLEPVKVDAATRTHAKNVAKTWETQ